MSDSTIIVGLAHACYYVKDLDASLAFYCDGLGLTPAFERVQDGVRYGYYIKVGPRQFLELFERPVGEKAEGQSYQHLCLEVADMQDAMARLQANGVEVTGFKRGKDLSWQAWVVDPDGNRIELHEYTEESLQTPWVE